LTPFRIDARAVQNVIHVIGAQRPRRTCVVPFCPCVPESVEPLAAALCARSVSRGERHGLIEEKELCIAPWSHHGALAAAEFEHTRDPAAIEEGPHDLAPVIVDRSAAIPHECAARTGTEDFPVRIDAVFERHQTIIPSGATEKMRSRRRGPYSRPKSACLSKSSK